MVGGVTEVVIIFDGRIRGVEGVGGGAEVEEFARRQLDFRHGGLAFFLALKRPARQIDRLASVILELQVFLFAEGIVQVVVVDFGNSDRLGRQTDPEIFEDGAGTGGLGRDLVIETHGIGVARGQIFREVGPDVAAGRVAAAAARSHDVQAAFGVVTVRIVPESAGVVAPGHPVVDIGIEITVRHVILGGVTHLEFVDQYLASRVHVDVHLGGVAGVVGDGRFLPFGSGLDGNGVRFVGEPGGHGGGRLGLLDALLGPTVERAVLSYRQGVAQRSGSVPGGQRDLVEAAFRIESKKLRMKLGVVHAVIKSHFLNVVAQDRKGEFKGRIAQRFEGRIADDGKRRDVASGGIGFAGRSVKLGSAPAFNIIAVKAGIQEFQRAARAAGQRRPGRFAAVAGGINNVAVAVRQLHAAALSEKLELAVNNGDLVAVDGGDGLLLGRGDQIFARFDIKRLGVQDHAVDHAVLQVNSLCSRVEEFHVLVVVVGSRKSAVVHDLVYDDAVLGQAFSQGREFFLDGLSAEGTVDVQSVFHLAAGFAGV